MSVVLMIASSPHRGGAERSLVELAVALADKGEFEPLLLCPSDGALCETALREGVTTGAFHAPLSPNLPLPRAFRLAVSAFRQRRSLRSALSDHFGALVHVNGMKAALAAIPACGRRRGPCVVHVRDYPQGHAAERWVAQRATALIAPSLFAANAAIQHWGVASERIHVLPNGVAARSRILSPGETRQRLRRAHRIEPDASVVAMAAQFVPWKRHDLLLDAVARLCENGRNVRVLFAGGDWWGTAAAYVASLRARAAQSPLRGRVHFLGHIESMEEIYAAADVVVLPSRHEIFGRVVVEAWRARCPVVVSDCGGAAELVAAGTAGLTFPAGNAEALANALTHVLDDSRLCARLTEGGFAMAARYTPERHAAAVCDLYRELLA